MSFDDIDVTMRVHRVKGGCVLHVCVLTSVGRFINLGRQNFENSSANFFR